jgi:hypothetical protein
MLAVTAALLVLLRVQPSSSFSALWPSLVAMGIGIGLVVVASTDAIMANAPEDQAGLAGGLQAVSVQLGGVLGSSVLGSVVAARVGSTLAGELGKRGVADPVASQVVARKDLAAQGVVPPGVHSEAATQAVHAAFVGGLHTAFVLGAAVTFVGAVAGLFIRRGDRTGEVVVVHA